MEEEKIPKIGEKMLWLEDENQIGVTVNGYTLAEWDAMTDDERTDVRSMMLLELMGE